MSAGILGTNVHLKGADNTLDGAATLTFAAGSVFSVQATHASAILDALGTPAKGSLAVRTASAWVLLDAGTDGNVLTLDSAQAKGVKWAAGASGSGTVTHTGSLTAHYVVLGNGSADIKPIGSPGTANQVLHGNASADPTWSAVDLAADITGVLPAANGGTGQSSYTTGDLLFASGSTALSKLAAVAVGSVLVSAGTTTAPAWNNVLSLGGTTDATSVSTGTLIAAGGMGLAKSLYMGSNLYVVGGAVWSTSGIGLTGKQLLFGYDTANSVGYLRSANNGTAYTQFNLDASAFQFSVGSGVLATAMTLDSTGCVVTGLLSCSTTFQTAAPAGSSAGLWKFGALQTGLTLTANLTQALYVDVGGTVYKLITGS